MSMETKTELRKTLRLQRSSMARADLAQKSAQITISVQAILDKVNFGSLHCYEPIVKLHEVDVSELLDTPDVALYTSRKLNGEWHIVSVIDDLAKPDSRLDVIIVPMLGFDDTLQRIGYGGGYYDQLLAKYPDALKIGICYEAGRLDHIPAEPHDIPMNIIVTEVRALIAV
jgi:5-formyltetrahydrofolate cyclo-ligase